MRSSFWFKAIRAARNLPLWFAVVLFAGCGGGSDRPVPQISEPQSGDVLSSTAYVAPGVNGDGKLLVHLMPGLNGSLIRATSLVFVPKGSPPVGGWPVVTWAHGTTTVGQPSCAPSLKPAALDGNLTTEGAVLGVEPSGYADLIAALVGAGYAVVAPDFEGLGTEAQAPYPYYSFSSLSRSLVAATRAAYKSVPGLSKKWAVVGHSDGGHAAVAVEKFAGEAPELDYKGAVAIAPFVSIRHEVDLLSANAATDPSNAANYVVFQNLLVGMMTTGLIAQQPGFDAIKVMGSDLLAMMPTLKNSCIFAAFGAVGAAVASKTPAAFNGFKSDWAADPAMSAFLAANDPGVMPGFMLRKPTLILQGSADAAVLQPMVDDFVGELRTAGSPAVTYKLFPGASHQSIVPRGTADTLTFLQTIVR